MANVYRVDWLNGSVYVNTLREARAFAPADEEPCDVRRLDPAAECTRLAAEIDALEYRLAGVRRLLEELFDVCPEDVIDGTAAGRAARKFLELKS